MARGKIGYLPSGYLNSAASATPGGSTDAESGLPIATGLTVGLLQEFTDAEALRYSAPTGRTLYSGSYQWVQLDPTVVGTVALGAALYWLQTATGYVVTNVATANVNAPDFAGVSIDPNFGAALPYAFIQVNGKASCLFDSSAAVVYGDLVLLTAGADTFAAAVSTTAITTAADIQAYVGNALSAGAASTVQLARIVRSVARF